MMPEISLNILDIAQNSIRAEATLIQISVLADTSADTLTVLIKDNGKGMTQEQAQSALDPFFTTRITRKIGLGLPFYKFSAESTGGSFKIESQPGVGTTIEAVFILSSIDRMPLGDMTSTVHILITMNPQIDFLYTFQFNRCHFALDTREIREIMGEIPFSEPAVSSYIKECLTENHREVNPGKII